MKAQIKAKLEAVRAPSPPMGQEPHATQMMERHYTFKELAAVWNLSYEKVRRMFINEAGTVPFGDTYRIPESVARRIYARLANR